VTWWFADSRDVILISCIHNMLDGWGIFFNCPTDDGWHKIERTENIDDFKCAT